MSKKSRKQKNRDIIRKRIENRSKEDTEAFNQSVREELLKDTSEAIDTFEKEGSKHSAYTDKKSKKNKED